MTTREIAHRPLGAIGDLVNGPAVTVEAKATLQSVAQTLGDLGIGIVVVCESGTPVGVLSERDLVWAIARDAARSNHPSLPATALGSNDLVDRVDRLDDIRVTLFDHGTSHLEGGRNLTGSQVEVVR